MIQGSELPHTRKDGIHMKLGEYQELTDIKKVDFGIYLAENRHSQEKVLLPAKQVPKDLKLGDTLNVFLYKDSRDRLIATTNEPKLTMGELKVLTVKEVGKIGAFLYEMPHKQTAISHNLRICQSLD